MFYVSSIISTSLLTTIQQTISCVAFKRISISMLSKTKSKICRVNRNLVLYPLQTEALLFYPTTLRNDWSKELTCVYVCSGKASFMTVEAEESWRGLMVILFAVHKIRCPEQHFRSLSQKHLFAAHQPPSKWCLCKCTRMEWGA